MCGRRTCGDLFPLAEIKDVVSGAMAPKCLLNVSHCLYNYDASWKLAVSWLILWLTYMITTYELCWSLPSQSSSNHGLKL